MTALSEYDSDVNHMLCGLFAVIRWKRFGVEVFDSSTVSTPNVGKDSVHPPLALRITEAAYVAYENTALFTQSHAVSVKNEESNN